MKFYVAGRPATSDDEVVVRHPYDGAVVGRTANATPDQVEEAVAREGLRSAMDDYTEPRVMVLTGLPL